MRKGVWKRYGEGQKTAAKFGDTEEIPILITGVAYKKLAELSDDDARLDGFGNLMELRQAITAIYGDLSPQQPMTVIYFSLTESPGDRKP